VKKLLVSYEQREEFSSLSSRPITALSKVKIAKRKFPADSQELYGLFTKCEAPFLPLFRPEEGF
jgi:hypothetical protein